MTKDAATIIDLLEDGIAVHATTSPSSRSRIVLHLALIAEQTGV